MRGFTNVLRLLSRFNGADYSCYLTEVRSELCDIFSKFETKFGAVRSQRAAQTASSGKKKTAWGKLFGEDGAGAGASVGAGLGAGIGADAGLGTGLDASISVSSSLSRRISASSLL